MVHTQQYLYNFFLYQLELLLVEYLLCIKNYVASMHTLVLLLLLASISRVCIRIVRIVCIDSMDSRSTKQLVCILATLEQYQLQYGYILRGCHQYQLVWILLIWSSFEFLRLPVMDFDFSFLLASTVRAIFRILRKRRGGAEPNREDSSLLLLIFQLKF